VKRLVVADILVTEVDENDVNLAIERKTVSDLRASLRDGRFARLTCSRMVECYGTERCVYIIEGECESTELGVLMSLQFGTG
jgi:ERCC4-type nuclease